MLQLLFFLLLLLLNLLIVALLNLLKCFYLMNLLSESIDLQLVEPLSGLLRLVHLVLLQVVVQQVPHLAVLVLQLNHPLMLLLQKLFLSSESFRLVSDFLAGFLDLVLHELDAVANFAFTRNFIQCLLLQIVHALQRVYFLLELG